MFLQSVFWRDGIILIIDQNELPKKLVYRELKSLEDVANAIKSMRVRGAPLLGVVTALGLALVAYKKRLEGKELIEEIKKAGEYLISTRPTAVNIEWAVKTVLNNISEKSSYRDVVRLANNLIYDDFTVNLKIAKIGAKLIKDGDKVLTHCNTGSLATVAVGTALGVILEAVKEGKVFEIYITETRPKLQGARLTAFELYVAGASFTLIVDSAVAHTIKEKGINKIFVGADRILRDGTTYNKIGTLQMAIVAKKYGIDFYVVAPSSTFDLEKRADEVIIESRSDIEVKKVGTEYITLPDINVYNPAFDATPPNLITAFITERGIIYPPFNINIRKMLG